jgi:hypothetical protein
VLSLPTGGGSWASGAGVRDRRAGIFHLDRGPTAGPRDVARESANVGDDERAVGDPVVTRRCIGPDVREGERRLGNRERAMTKTNNQKPTTVRHALYVGFTSP